MGGQDKLPCSRQMKPTTYSRHVVHVVYVTSGMSYMRPRFVSAATDGLKTRFAQFIGDQPPPVGRTTYSKRAWVAFNVG